MPQKEGENMAEKGTKKSGVQSGAEAESKKKKSTTAKTDTKKTTAKGGKTGKEIWEENIIRDSETAKEKGRKGGIKSGEVRRAKRDARETIQYMLGRMVVSENIKNNLKELGFETEEFTNMGALHGRLFTMAMSGNLEAYMLLMKMGGYEPEENRKERESISSDLRREVELNAKVEALGQKGDNASLAINLGDEDGDNDVVIYMPQIETVEDCEVKDEDKSGDGKSADNE